ncbi:MAG TPA: hypothetical protein VF808_05540 [Ktedonobacterales bacterium]
MRSARQQARIIGPLLAFLAGVAISVLPDWLTQALGLTNSPQPYVILGVFILAALIVGAGAWLLRSWWSALVVPALFFAGYILGALLDLRIMGSLSEPGYLMLAVYAFAFLYLIPLILIALLATAIAKFLARRLSRPASA